MPSCRVSGRLNTLSAYACPMQRWVASAQGGINQRLNPGLAIVRSLLKKSSHGPPRFRCLRCLRNGRWLSLRAPGPIFFAARGKPWEDRVADHPQDENSAPNQADDQPAVKDAHLAQGRAGRRAAGRGLPAQDREARPAAPPACPRSGRRSTAARATWGSSAACKTLLNLNQKDGFDCPSCAWPDPDDERKTAEFCENGAKAVASEATRGARHARVLRRSTRSRSCSQQSDLWLDQQGRLTHPMVRRAGRRPLRADLAGTTRSR